MWGEYNSGESRDEQNQNWERSHDHKLIWKCPECDYSYESERYVNEAMDCPHCGVVTEPGGESYGI